MRKLISSLGVSLDGYHSDVDGQLGWQTFGDEFTEYSIEQLDEFDTLVFGRITYQGMVEYWPQQVGRDFDNRIADIMNSIAKIVVSTTLTSADWHNTRVISGEVEKEVAVLKDQPGKDIAIFGSSTLTVHLLRAGLLDELRLMVNPVALGAGASVLEGADLTDFDLLRTRPFKAGNIQLTYAPKG